MSKPLPVLDPEKIMTWGEFKGSAIKDLPESYLYYMASRPKLPFRHTARAEIKRRLKARGAAPKFWE